MSGSARRRALLLLGVLLGPSLAPASAGAGAWTPAPGRGYAKAWLKWLHGIGYHAGDGRTIDYGGYEEVFYSLYGEVGLVEGLALTAHLPLMQLFSLEDPRSGDRTTHLFPGDPAVGLRAHVGRIGRLSVAAEASLRAPVAPSRPVQTVYASDGATAGALRVGAGVWDLTAGLAAGMGWDRSYAAAAVGYVERTGGYDPALLWTAESGRRFGEAWAGRVRVTGYHSLAVGEAARTESPSGIGSGVSYVGFALEGDVAVGAARLGLTVEGGLIGVTRQTGGPVTSLYLARAF